MRKLSVNHRAVLTILMAGVAAVASVAWSDVAKVSAIRVEKSPTATTYVIEQTGSVDFQDFVLSNPARLVVDLVGARHGLEQTTYEGDGRLVRGVRTSQFRSDPDEVTRVVFDLVEGAKFQVEKKENALEVRFFEAAAGSGGEPAGQPAGQPEVQAASFQSIWDFAAGNAEPRAKEPAAVEAEAQPSVQQAAVPQTQPPFEAPIMAEAQSRVQQAPVTEVRPPFEAPAATNVTPPVDDSFWSRPVRESASPAPETAMSSSPNQNTWTMRKPANSAQPDADLVFYDAAGGEPDLSGSSPTMMSDKRITMDIQGADIKTVLRSISEFSGANIVAGLEVEGPVDLHLVDVPWKEALEIILRANGYSMREEYGVIRVGTVDNLNDEEVETATVEKQKEDLTPMVTRVVKLNFVSSKDLKTALKGAMTKRGSVESERDNNAIIITDIPRVANTVADMVVGLDTRLNQVEIVAKMVDVDVEAIREIGVNWSALNLMSAEMNANGEAISGQSLADPFGSFSVGTVQSWGELMLTLEALEKDNRANIISNPRITTTDNKEASLLVGKEIPLIVADEAGNAITELKKVGITLEVTPYVNSEEQITLDLHPEVSDLSSQSTVQGGVIFTMTEADARVMVNEGETAVIGGLIRTLEGTTERGVPFIKDVPVLGYLFRHTEAHQEKRELLIFVTPRLVRASTDAGGQR